MIEKKFNKVFEVGSPKTGTTSLGRAFEILGLKHKGWDPYLFERYKAGDYREILATAEAYEAFEDGPWHAEGMYRIFDEKFPGSRFMFLERDQEDRSGSPVSPRERDRAADHAWTYRGEASCRQRSSRAGVKH